MTRDPAWLMFAWRRKPGWERRSRVRRAVAVVGCMVLCVSGSQPWWQGKPVRVTGITQTGAYEWTIEAAWWPEYKPVAVLVSSRETALRLEQALWEVGR